MKKIIKTSRSFTDKAENGESKICVFATFSDGTVEKVELSRIVFKSGGAELKN